MRMATTINKYTKEEEKQQRSKNSNEFMVERAIKMRDNE